MNQTLEQERAKRAWEQVNRDNREEYLSVVRSTPALILSCGLGQTLAFYCAKGGAAKTVADHLAEWLLGDNKRTAEDLLHKIMNNERDCYRQLTSEAIAYLIWLKRFAEAKEKNKH